jgi:predicted nucleotide-binding protein
MSTIKPEHSAGEAEALEALATFIGAWVAVDPSRGDGVPGAASLLIKLAIAAKDIRESAVYTDPVTLDQTEANAVVFLGRMFAAAQPEHAANARLARWVTGFAAHAKAVSDYPVGRNAWHHVAKSSRRVLIVSGRNRKAHRELQLWLKELHLDAVVMEAHSTQGSATAAEALETAMATCGTAIVLATPDDEGRLVVDEDGRQLRPGQNQKLQPRARQNVVLELGMLWGHLGRERVVLLIEKSVDIGTDTAGFMTIRFTDDVRTAFEDRRKRLQAMGVISISTGKK